MEPVLSVTVLLLLFAGTHIGLASGRLRAALLARLGEVGFTALFSLVAAATFAAVVHQYAVHRFDGPPGLALGAFTALRPVLMGIVVVGVTLAVAGVIVFPGSPMALFAEPGGPPRGLARITRHPFLVGMALVGSAHALLATRLVGTVAFGGLALFAIVGARHQDRKLGTLRGPRLTGRQRVVWRELQLGALATGLLSAFALRAVHGRILASGGAWVIGVTLALPVLLGFEAWRRVRNAGRVDTRLAGNPG